MNRNIVLSLTLLWCGALAAMEGVQTAPVLPSLDNIGSFDQWLREDESVKDDGDPSFSGRVRYVQKLNEKCDEYVMALTAEVKNIKQVWLPRLCNSKVIRNSEIGLRDQAIVHKTITKKCEAIAKGLIRFEALKRLICQKSKECGDLADEDWIEFQFHHSRQEFSMANLALELSNPSILWNHISHASLYADPELADSAIYSKNEKSIKEYILKTFSFHIPSRRMAHVLDTMNIEEVKLFVSLAVQMRRAVLESEINNLVLSRKRFVNFLQNAWYRYTYFEREGTPWANVGLLSILSSLLKTAAEDLKAVMFDEASSMSNERLKSLRALLDQQD